MLPMHHVFSCLRSDKYTLFCLEFLPVSLSSFDSNCPASFRCILSQVCNTSVNTKHPQAYTPLKLSWKGKTIVKAYQWWPGIRTERRGRCERAQNNFLGWGTVLSLGVVVVAWLCNCQNSLNYSFEMGEFWWM